MVGIGRLSTTEKFTIDIGPPAAGVGQVFEDNNPRPFSQDESVPVSIEWPAGSLRRVIPLGQGAGRAETSQKHRCKPGLCAAGHDDIRPP
jgi:hypothetical protein